MEPVRNLIETALCLPTQAIAYHTGRRLQEIFPEKAVVECSSCGFDLDGFVEAGLAHATPRAAFGHNQLVTTWKGCLSEWEQALAEELGTTCGTTEQELVRKPGNAFLHVTWQGKSLDLLQVSWPETMSKQTAVFLIAESVELAETFYRTVCAWSSVPHGEVLVFAQGRWRKDKALFQAIRSATLENLVLAPGLKEALVSDLTQFFSRREVYQRYGVPWKRGILLIGPPGNGKTHTIKALCNQLEVPALYVRSIDSPSLYRNEHASISQIFATARQSAPCLLVLEDLDALLKPGNRSFFLNELDGFAENAGVCVVASTNYPERLDPAILDRPSRFDRKYHFHLPAPAERAAYLALWNAKQTDALRLSEVGLSETVAATDGFSFAYLKELCLSATMAWINAGEGAAMDRVVMEQLQALRTQMQTAPGESALERNEEID